MQLYKQINSNKRRSIFMTIVVAVLFVAIGYAFVLLRPAWGWAPLVVAVLVVGVLSATSYWSSDKVALRSSGAVAVSRDEAPQLYNIVEGLCIGAGMPMPKLYIVHDRAPNAFATGRNPQHAAIAMTTGLLELMNRDELEGVLAHELSHIRNYDILLASMVVVLVGAIVIISDFFMYSMWFGGGRRGGNNSGGAGAVLAIISLVMIIAAPIAAKMIQLAVSRKRESLADVSGVEITRYPTGLRHALEKLEANKSVVRHASKATAHMWIESPLDGQKGHRGAALNRMFMTHPPLEERIAALRQLEAAGGGAPG